MKMSDLFLAVACAWVGVLLFTTAIKLAVAALVAIVIVLILTRFNK